mgnify:FL=1
MKMKKALSVLLSVMMVFSVFTVSQPAYAKAKYQLKASSITSSSAKMTWTKVKKADGYALERYDSKSKKWKTTKTVTSAKTTSYTVKKLKPYTKYNFRIRSYKKKGKKKSYSKTLAKRGVLTRPSAPNSLKVKYDNSGKYAGLKITWKKSSADGYKLMYSNDSKFKKSSSVYLGKTVTEYNIYNPSKAVFYVKIYSYKNYKGKKYYSPAAKTVKYKNNKKPKKISYSVKDYYIYNGSQKIFGRFYQTNKKGKRPTVILSHSCAMNGESLNAYSAAIAKAGYNAYAMDFRGGSKNSKSDGSMTKMTVFTEKSDLDCIIKKIRTLSTVDSNNVFLLGTSQGGLVSALSANNKSSQIRGLILMYPGLNAADDATKTYKGKKIPDTISLPMGMGTLGKNYIKTLIDYDVFKNIKGYTNNVIIFHGTMDNTVPISYSQKAVDTYKHAELIKISGAMHGFNSDNYSLFGDYDNQVVPKLLSFIKKNIK